MGVVTTKCSIWSRVNSWWKNIKIENLFGELSFYQLSLSTNLRNPLIFVSSLELRSLNNKSGFVSLLQLTSLKQKNRFIVGPSLTIKFKCPIKIILSIFKIEPQEFSRSECFEVETWKVEICRKKSKMFLGTFFAFSVLKFASSVPIKVTNEDLSNGKKNSYYILYETSPFILAIQSMEY